MTADPDYRGANLLQKFRELHQNQDENRIKMYQILFLASGFSPFDLI